MDHWSEDQIHSTLTDIARLNDDAVLHWAMSSSSNNEPDITGHLLLQAANQVNSLSRILLMIISRQGQLVLPNKTDQTTSFTVLPVDVDPPGIITVCFNRAFLVKPMRPDATILAHDICIVAAVVFYNYALFFHQQAEQDNDNHAIEVISKYYETSHSILRESTAQMLHMKPVMWNLIAAVLYNLAECNRSPSYFGHLEAIVSNISDPEDYAFYKRAIAMAKFQLMTCCTAGVA